jgi:curved DNA-binding protein CbpA
MNLHKALKIFDLKNIDFLSLEELKKIYRKLAKEKHPDRSGSDSQFVELREAYLFLYARVKQDELERATKVSKNSLKELSKDEILNKYYHDTKDLQIKIEEYQENFDGQAETLEEIKSQVEQIITKFEEKKAKLRSELEIEIAKLEQTYSSNFLRKLFFFLPKMSEDEFWQKYHSKVQKYSRKDADTDVSFFKEMLSVYGDGLNEISKIILQALPQQNDETEKKR